jgi:transposase
MKLTQEQRDKIIRLFPKQRGNVKVDNNRFLDAIIYICENDCKWRSLPETFGPWHTIYVRINRWAKNGVLERLFHALQQDTGNKQADNGAFLGFKFGKSPS